MCQITMNEEDFATLVICAIRYCHGRRTYMPSLVQGIVRGHLHELTDGSLYVMHKDCEEMNDLDCGDPLIDKPEWLKWKEDLEKEQKRRTDGNQHKNRTDRIL